MRTSIAMALIVVLGLGLAGCGKKTQLIPPEGATFPRQYPQP